MDNGNVVSDRYLVNPDVGLREEDPNGGLLYNADTNRLRVINRTGLFIWKICGGTQDLRAIVDAVQKAFQGVPTDQVRDQVKAYIDELVAAGFIGIAEGQVH